MENIIYQITEMLHRKRRIRISSV